MTDSNTAKARFARMDGEHAAIYSAVIIERATIILCQKKPSMTECSKTPKLILTTTESMAGMSDAPASIPTLRETPNT